MTEQDAERETAGKDGEVESAAPSDKSKVVGENADVPAGEGEEADETGVEGGQDGGSSTKAADSSPSDSGESGSDSGESGSDSHSHSHSHSDTDGEDDRDELAREIESDPSSNPDDPLLREIKGG